MEIKYYLLDEVKRLNRMNDLLEKELIRNKGTNLAIYEVIQKNTSTICDIVEVL